MGYNYLHLHQGSLKKYIIILHHIPYRFPSHGGFSGKVNNNLKQTQDYIVITLTKLIWLVVYLPL